MSETAFTPMPTTTVIQVGTPSELAEAIPYLLGARPTDSLVLLGIRPEDGRVGPVLRLDLPPPERFAAAAHHHTAQLLQHGARFLSSIVYVDSQPRDGTRGVDFYRPLAESVAGACRRRALALQESICVQNGRVWSYICRIHDCCPPDGTPLPTERHTAVAAAAVTAGIPPPIPLSELAARVRPPEFIAREAVRQAFVHRRAELKRQADVGGRDGLQYETIALLQAARTRFAGGDCSMTYDEAARLVLGLDDRRARDHAMSWQDDALLPLWTALARRSLPPDSAVPLSLVAWEAWTGDQPAFARVAVNRALEADPTYRLAQLLHTAINGGLDPVDARALLFPARSPRRGTPPSPPSAPPSTDGNPTPTG
ncbi:DUF4192 domain-containing protein [Yinghuangia sp. YIM S09857]|uniref:DUF4192 domain-containing protein n=1 Tax=Yinghuangia sp. YIM S09857 TaxID=3436929 RepID=UPI003F534596